MTKTISLDCESTGLDIRHGARAFFVTTCEPGGVPYCWEWPVDPLTRGVEPDPADLEEIRERIKGCDTLVGQNIKFDALALSVYGVEIPWEKTEDTLIAAHVLASGMRHDLTSLGEQYLSVSIKKYEDALEDAVKKARSVVRRHYKDWKIARENLLNPDGSQAMPSAQGESPWKFDMWMPRALVNEWRSKGQDIPEEYQSWDTVLEDYSNADSSITAALWPVMKAELQRRNLWGYYKEQMKLVPIFRDIEDVGLTVLGKNLREQVALYEEGACESMLICQGVAEHYLVPCPECQVEGTQPPLFCGTCEGKKEIPYPLTFPRGTRNDCLREFAFKHLKLPVVQTTEKGNPSMDKTAVEKWLLSLDKKSRAYHFVRELADWTKRQTAITYMKGYERYWFTTPDEGVYLLHPVINLTGTATLRKSSSWPNEQNICFDGDTELLTMDGWVKAEDFRVGQQVAQYWPNSKSIDFCEPEYHVIHHRGHMVHLQTEQQIDMLLTPNHRCLLADRKTGRRFDVLAKDFRSDCKHYQAGHYVGGDQIYSDAQVAWLCAVQADGYYCNGDGGEFGIRFIFSKKRKIDRIRWCLKELGVRYTESKAVKGTSFYVGKHEPVVKLVRRLMPGKKLGPWLLECDRDTLDRIKDELFLWDGDSTRRAVYSSSDKESADWAQIILSLSGSRTNLVSRWPSSEWSKREHHYVNVTHGKDYSLTSNFTSEKIPWDGYVYCVTVPSSYVVTRRNGRVAITGNSKKENFNLRYCFGPGPGREWWSLDAANIELRLPAYEAQERDMIALFEQEDAPPFYGSNHLLNFSVVYLDIWEAAVKEVGLDKAGPYCKKKYKDTWYQWCKNGDFAIQYGGQKKTVDAAFHRDGCYELLQAKFSGLSKLNRWCINFAEKHGYIETIPDRNISLTQGYPLMCARTENGSILPTIPLNYRIQGSACYWMRKANVRVYHLLQEWNRKIPRSQLREKGYFIIADIHDEMLYSFPKAADPRVNPKRSNLGRIRQVKRLMELGGEDFNPRIPTPVSAEYHPNNWSEGIRF